MPLPGPSVTRNFTGRCGQVCAGDGVAETTNASAAAKMKTQRNPRIDLPPDTL
jgi:hypothetical protein